MAGSPSEGHAALAASAAHVAAQQTEWSVVKQHVASGELRFDPQALDGCVAACEKMFDHIGDQLGMAQELSNVDGFGHTVVGDQLSGKFAAQATAAMEVLNAHQALLLDMITTFKQAASNYAGTDGRTAGAMGGGG